jgi:hypothetical protein
VLRDKNDELGSEAARINTKIRRENIEYKDKVE